MSMGWIQLIGLVCDTPGLELLCRTISYCKLGESLGVKLQFNFLLTLVFGSSPNVSSSTMV